MGGVVEKVNYAYLEISSTSSCTKRLASYQNQLLYYCSYVTSFCDFNLRRVGHGCWHHICSYSCGIRLLI